MGRKPKPGRASSTSVGGKPAEPIDKPFDLTPRRSLRSKVLRSVSIAATIVVLAAAGFVIWLNRRLDEIPTFAESAPGWVGPPETFSPDITVAATTPPPDVTKGIDGPSTPPPPPPGERGTSFLIFSTGSQRLSADDARRLNIPPDRAVMSDGLTDSIMVVVVYPKNGQVGILSIPRDLYIPQLNDRINTIYVRSGPRALALTVGRMTGLPIDHMIAVNFSAFGELTDAVGGVDLWVDGPARDVKTGFEVKASSCVRMDGATALAFARSRRWEVFDGASWRVDSSATDFGRIKRQQALVRAAAKKLASPAGLGMIGTITGVAQRTLIVDPELDFRAVSALGLDMLRSASTTIQTFSYAGTAGWAGAASVVYTDARANAATLAALQRLLRGERVEAAAGGTPAPPAAGPEAAGAPRGC
ncbi:MAG: LCP family protein [Actinobacteria bacterium]|nr:LCP family protein [Actinomycetota bacterium]